MKRTTKTSQNTFSDDAYDNFIQNLEIPKLSDDKRDSLEGPLTFHECKKVPETFQNDKAPGEDGFTAEFYIYIFDLLGNDLIASFNEADEVNEFTISQRRGVITLIPKEDGSLLELSNNWRPITLLNVDFNIAAKAIAKRLESILPNLIQPDQTGFIIKGHSIEWPFIMTTLDYFNFGSDIKRWVSTFHTNIESTVLNNGFATNWSKGVRQGCPLSPYQFILSAEILAHKIRQDPSYNGIKIFGNEVKLSLFADDINIFCADLASVTWKGP